MKKTKRFSKKAYIYLALVTMAAVSLFAKPIKHGFSALNRRLRKASHQEEKVSLRKSLKQCSGLSEPKKHNR